MTATKTDHTPLSPIATQALHAAIELRSAKRLYAETRNDIIERVGRVRQDVLDAERYGETYGAKAGDITTALDRIASNMRLDLLAKYASKVDTNQALLNVLLPMVTDEAERVQVERWIVE